ncbi:hypothetical protein BST61_g9584 [Cercospora zeina]
MQMLYLARAWYDGDSDGDGDGGAGEYPAGNISCLDNSFRRRNLEVQATTVEQVIAKAKEIDDQHRTQSRSRRIVALDLLSTAYSVFVDDRMGFEHSFPRNRSRLKVDSEIYATLSKSMFGNPRCMLT